MFNAASGRGEVRRASEQVAARLHARGQAHVLHVVEQPAALPELAVRAVHEAREAGGLVVAAGGDGTLNTVAQAVWNADLPFAVLPQGTFNYFGRAHGMAQDLEGAVDALLNAREEPVSVGMVGERIFLVNASVGLYPRLLEDRERAKRRFGRSRLVALLAAADTLLRGRHTLTLQVELNGQTHVLRARTLFVGNNPLQLAELGLPEAEAVAQGQLAAIALEPLSRWAMAALALRGALRGLAGAEGVSHIAFEDMTVRPRRTLPGLRAPRRMKVAMDGEVGVLPTPLRFRVAPRPLRLWLPPRFAELPRATFAWPQGAGEGGGGA